MLCGLKTILTDMNILNSYRHIRPKKLKYPIPQIPDDSGKKSGTDWVLPKIIGSGRVSGTRQALIPSSCLQFPYFWIVVARPEKIRNHLPERGQSLGASFGVIGLWAETFPLGSDYGAGHLPLGLSSVNRSLAPIQGTPRDGSPQPSTLL